MFFILVTFKGPKSGESKESFLPRDFSTSYASFFLEHFPSTTFRLPGRIWIRSHYRGCKDSNLGQPNQEFMVPNFRPLPTLEEVTLGSGGTQQGEAFC